MGVLKGDTRSLVNGSCGTLNSCFFGGPIVGVLLLYG